ncbi:hypothetical protein AVEN_25096-1 [Araneus ventricosus]|uniref:Uncharacterized protein n=1 Tax=Araneus ventricosus TaxID=182803 RepID=A0A4Y2JEL2_ARAVE|nr:hypothetical protein AVEN_25096-1 [Araneus ventricosus]
MGLALCVPKKVGWNTSECPALVFAAKPIGFCWLRVVCEPLASDQEPSSTPANHLLAKGSLTVRLPSVHVAFRRGIRIVLRNLVYKKIRREAVSAKRPLELSGVNLLTLLNCDFL